jgi:serine/threonine-protein kinase
MPVPPAAHDSLSYFALELVEGGSLAGRIRGRPQPPRAAAALVATVARGTHAPHQEGILHRDLKPANVLLQISDLRLQMADFSNKSAISNLQSAIPKIADFGLAKWLGADGALTQTGMVAGTPSYMAPEQARGDRKQVGIPAEVWARGANLYECLTGRPPFQAPTPAQTLQQVCEAEAVSPRRLQPGLPRDLETVYLQCLQKQPAKRYGSAPDLADDM